LPVFPDKEILMRLRITAVAAVIAGLAGLLASQVQAQADGAKPADGAKLYTVVDGNKVDANTLKGWRTWRAMACERCHGANQEGMVGPSLIDSLKVLSKDQFKQTVLNGRVDKGMPNFGGSEQVTQNIDNLYAYLKGRSDGAIKPGRVESMEK
jgi:mono/diheme cytochrome c family protein